MRASEYYLIESTGAKLISKFIPWVAKQLDINDLPEIIFLDQPKTTAFGHYDPELKKLFLVIKNRNPIDILRTLAHELTHHKQNLEGRLYPGAGETGTDEENEANANAGIVMREFADKFPEFFGIQK